MVTKPHLHLLGFFTNMTKDIPWHWLAPIGEWIGITALIASTCATAFIVLKLRQAP